MNSLDFKVPLFKSPDLFNIVFALLLNTTTLSNLLYVYKVSKIFYTAPYYHSTTIQQNVT